jgi:Flp pilus assembly pilin Flp
MKDMVQKEKTRKPIWQSGAPGQALMEYALILILVAVALAAALIATGPALGNVFSNTVYNLIGQEGTPQQELYNRGGPTAFWETITAVALNPPSDRAVPTNPPAPAEPTSSPGPSPTPTPPTPTLTPSFTPTVTISPTPNDIGHNAPFVDPIDNPEWWRVDSSVWLGGDDWRGEYYPNRNLTAPATKILYNGQVNAQSRFNIKFDWGTGSPLDSWISNDFSIRFTRTVYVFGTNSMTLNFNVLSDEGVRVCIDAPKLPDGTVPCGSAPKIIDQWSGRTFDSGPLSAVASLSGGPAADSLTAHTITLEYYEASGTAGVFLDISGNKGNVLADQALPSGPANCQWARATGSQPNTVSWAWEESGAQGNGFPPNMRCNLELRGWVDLAGLGAPQFTFWEVWDFSAAASSKLQIAEYVPYNADGTGGPNWATGTTVTLRSGGKNYAWTQNTVPIPTGLIGKQITYRFVLESGGGTGIRRYYIDDIEIRDPNMRTFNVWCGNAAQCPDSAYYDMDTTGMKDNFITTGRWDLTATNTAESSPMSWDVGKFSSGKYVRFGNEQAAGDYRIHAVEFSGNVSLPFNPDGTGGLPDFEGDDGYPQLTFYQSWDLDRGEALEIQWTRDARDAVPDNWQTLTTLVSTGGSTSIQPMDQISIPLNTIPSWNSSPFRLRFAMKVDKDYTDKGGWWIDSIVIDRKGRPKFGTYPFCDDAENGHNQWLFSGQWGETTSGAFGSSRSFTDSPAGNYYVGQETAMEQKYVIDYNNDTPENFVAPFNGNRDCAGNPSGAAVRPILTFWHNRALGSSHTITVDLYRPSHTPSGTTLVNWTPVWTYSYNSTTRIQVAWERVVIDMQSSIEAVTGQTWAALTGGANTNKYDDDFMFRVRLDTRSGSGTGNGVYVDSINISNYAETSHKLWDQGKTVTVPATEPPAGGGNGGLFVDDVDTPEEWWLRWNTGGEWTAVEWDQHSGLKAFHDHADSGTTYADKQFSVLEMNRIIDLRGTVKTDQPTLYFWDHYDIGSGDSAVVQIAIEDKTRTTQAYNYVRGWGSSASYGSPNFSSWQPIMTIGQNKRVDTWVREQIDLSAFADDATTTGTNEGKRIKIRFVLNTYNTSSGLRQGWWIDDVSVKFRNPRIMGLPFFDAAQNTSNWVTEGLWGLAPDKWRGSGGGPASLGNDPYDAYYFDCIRWLTNYNPPAPVPNTGGTADFNATTCDPNNTNRFLNSVPRVISLPGANNDITDWIAARPSLITNPAGPFLLTGQTSTVNYDFGTTGRPPGAPAGSAGNKWDNDYMGRWYRNITVLAGDYTFITTSDDGVRLFYSPNGTAWTTIINNWTTHGRTVDFGTVTLAAGSYQLVLEWFENSGGATIIMQVGNNNFSFSDSPKPGAGPAFPQVDSVAYGNSSLILDGLLNLNNPGVPAGSWIPRLQYYTYYQLGSSATAQAEVTIDGGFSWTTANLQNNCPGGGAQCNPTIWGWSDWLEANGDWQLRSHDLRGYANRNIGLRFRLNTTSSVRDGWWITEIQVNN